MATPITITDNVAKKVYELIREEGNEALKLRVCVEGGGCQGLQYCFAFVETAKELDQQFDKTFELDGQAHKLTFLVDSISLTYLQGATIDYREDVKGSHFVVQNPKQNTTCGCGASFS